MFIIIMRMMRMMIMVIIRIMTPQKDGDEADIDSTLVEENFDMTKTMKILLIDLFLIMMMMIRMLATMMMTMTMMTTTMSRKQRRPSSSARSWSSLQFYLKPLAFLLF